MTFSKTPDYIRDNLCTFDGEHFYKVPSINGACRGCALHQHPDPDCYTTVKCMASDESVASILIHTDEASIVRYIQARLE